MFLLQANDTSQSNRDDNPAIEIRILDQGEFQEELNSYNDSDQVEIEKETQNDEDTHLETGDEVECNLSSELDIVSGKTSERFSQENPKIEKRFRLMSNHLQKPTTKVNFQSPQDEIYDQFGKYVASILRGVGPPVSWNLQAQITSLLLRRLRDFSN